jgi:hypothetical protein
MVSNRSVHVIFSKNRWKVIRSDRERALGVFEERDIAIVYAERYMCKWFPVKLGILLWVHKQDGSVEYKLKVGRRVFNG